ncbi:MAG TPA: alpha-amylase [Thermoflexia bacterium]|nr:alpha-amylase [Thermoflexia bacterium]
MSIETSNWVKDAIFYQIFPDRFAQSERVFKPKNLEPWDAPPTKRGFKGGDLLGVEEHLDYLVELGITALYFNPIFQSAANHRYHTHCYLRVDPLLGGNEAFQQLLAAAHARGIRVILDGVFNHASRGFFQFNHIMENNHQSPYIDWFVVNGFPLRAFQDEEGANYVCWWDNRELPKLNTENPAVREFIFEVAEYWLEQGIDGWRLDVPLEITTPGFWEEFRRRVKAINPEAYILAEIWHEAREWLQGEHFDAVMNYPFNRACLGFFGGAVLDTEFKPGGFALEALTAEDFARQVDEMLTLYAPEVTQAQFNLLSSHDEPRFLTLVGGETRRLKLATLFQMTFPGAPSIYYGDEIGMEGGEDPDCRRGFPWEEERWDQDLLADMRRYIALRQAHPVLRRGEYLTLYAQGELYAFARYAEEELVVVAFNVGGEAAELQLELAGLPASAQPLVDAWSGAELALQGDRAVLQLAPLSARVWVR